MKNYYDVLGIESNSSNEQIKQAYRSLITKAHPDKRQGDSKLLSEAQLWTPLIQEAYDYLSDERTRKEYDKTPEEKRSTHFKERLVYYKITPKQTSAHNTNASTTSSNNTESSTSSKSISTDEIVNKYLRDAERQDRERKEKIAKRIDEEKLQRRKQNNEHRIPIQNYEDNISTNSDADMSSASESILPKFNCNCCSITPLFTLAGDFVRDFVATYTTNSSRMLTQSVDENPQQAEIFTNYSNN